MRGRSLSRLERDMRRLDCQFEIARIGLTDLGDWLTIVWGS